MKESVSVSELRRNLPSVASAVARGREVLVTRRGRPLMRLVPCEPEPIRPEDHPFRKLRVHLASDFDEPMEELWEAFAR